MVEAQNFSLVLVTVPNSTEANRISFHLVENKLAACVNIVSSIVSVYFWKEKVQKEEELLLLIKTKKEKLEELEKAILQIHSYETPEIVSLPFEKVEKNYLQWLNQSLS